MKKIILSLTAAAMSFTIIYSQPCLPEGITFTTQEQIDNFQTNYPGCTEIEGNVTISDNGSGNITNLNGLSVLTYIGGDFYIGSYYNGDNPSLMTLSGLENLTSVGGHVRIRYNVAITSLNGLENLNTIGGRLSIYNNDTLNNLSGLEGLNSIGYTLSISENNILTSLAGLYNLSAIGGILSIVNNDSLTSLTGLDNIESGSIDSLYIYENYSLEACNVESLCEYLMAPTGIVNIYNNAQGCNNPPEIATSCGYLMPCLPYGDYFFYSQEDVDNFQTMYTGCTELDGDVIISGNDITNLNGLNNITTIDNLEINSNNSLASLTGFGNLASIVGNLEVDNNDALTSLTGLENLTSVEESLYIGGNYALTNLTGLQNLTTIGGGLTIGNEALTSLTELESLTSIGGGLHLIGNTALVSLSGLESLTSIGGTLEIISDDALTSLTGLQSLTSIGGGLSICYNNALTSFVGLDNLSYIGDSLFIDHNPYLESLTGLNSLDSISGNLTITGNEALITLTGLENLKSIAGDLTIGVVALGYSSGGNYALTDISSLGNLAAGSIDNLLIGRNFSLSSCDVQSICDYLASPNGVVNIYWNAPGCDSQSAVTSSCGGSIPCLPYGNYYFTTQTDIDNFQINYPGCTELEGNVTINGYDITNLNGLNMVTSIVGGLNIVGNSTLTSLSGLESLTSIGGNLQIGSFFGGVNPALISLSGLESLISIGGWFSINYNDALISLSGLESLTFVGGGLDIYYNDALTSLSGLESLTSIGEGLWIRGNDALTSLSGLDNLGSIDGDLIIGGDYWDYGNLYLNDISGLGNLAPGSIENLQIGYNASLSNCDVQSICEYLSAPIGTIEIHDNAQGCDSPEEVELHCLTQVEEIKTGNGITIIPNPSKDKIIISSPALTGNTKLSIFNVSGEKVIERQLTATETLLDISALPKGVYFVRLQNERMVEVTKVVKQ